MIHVGLYEFRDVFRRRPTRLESEQTFALGQSRGQRLRVLARRSVGAVEILHRSRHLRGRGEQLPDLPISHPAVDEYRIAEDLLQGGDELPFVVLRERLQIE